MATTQATTAAAGATTSTATGGPGSRGAGSDFGIKARSQRQQIVRRFLHNKVGMTGLVIFVLMLVFGFIGPLVYGVDYASQNVNAQSVGPGVAGYPLGSDEIGRDELAGLMQGVQRSLFIVLLYVAIALPTGVLGGGPAGQCGRLV